MAKRTFKVLYTTQLTQKTKRWTDGVATFVPALRRFELFAANADGEPTVAPPAADPQKSLCCETIADAAVDPGQEVLLTTFRRRRPADAQSSRSTRTPPPRRPPSRSRPRRGQSASSGRSRARC